MNSFQKHPKEFIILKISKIPQLMLTLLNAKYVPYFKVVNKL